MKPRFIQTATQAIMQILLVLQASTLIQAFWPVGLWFLQKFLSLLVRPSNQRLNDLSIMLLDGARKADRLLIPEPIAPSMAFHTKPTVAARIRARPPLERWVSLPPPPYDPNDVIGDEEDTLEFVVFPSQQSHVRGIGMPPANDNEYPDVRAVV